MPFQSSPLKGGDGRLTAALDPHDQGPQDACGVFGVWAPGEDVAKLTYFGLYALQHRGQESAGIAVSNGRQILVYKDMGLVSQVFDETTLGSLKGHVAIGHARYSTTGASRVGERAADLPGDRRRLHRARPQRQPDQHRRARRAGRGAAQSPRASDLHAAARGSTNDTDLLTALLAHHPDAVARGARARGPPDVNGAFSLVFMDEDTLYAARDPQGIRPLVLGRLDRGWVVASEDAALDIVGASVVREIEPGELIVIDENGLRSHRFAEAGAQGLRLRVRLPGPPRHQHRRPQRPRVPRRDGPQAGPRGPRRRRPGHPDAGVRHPRRDRLRGGVSGIPFGQGLVKNAYVGRTFIQPSQTIRQLGIRLKLNALEHVMRGQAARRRRRLDRPRQHPARPGPDAARGRRARGPRADLLAAGEVAVLLRHRLRHPRRADRQRHDGRRDRRHRRRRLASLHLPRRHDRGDRPVAAEPLPACFDGEYPMELPDPSCSASSSWSRRCAVADRAARRSAS